MRSIEDLIGEHPLLADLPDTDRELLAGCGHNVRFSAGTYLFHEGDPADTFFLVRSGRIAVELQAPGRTPLVITTVGPEGIVGWSWLFPPYEWRFDARGLDDVRAVSIDAVCLRAKCEADHSLGYRLMQRFAQLAVDHLQAARVQLLDLYANPGAP
jgi:CRP-like cAMP-binding protein